MDTLLPHTRQDKDRENESQYLPSMPRALTLTVQSVLNWLAQYMTGVLLLSVLIALVLWGGALPSIDPNRMTDLGLISVLSPLVYVALGILILSFCLAIAQKQLREPLLALHVIALIIIIHATPNIVYGTLRYSWAWKHTGLVDYILRHGSVDPSIAVLGVYHNWPGFFAFSALVTEIGGFGSAVEFAGWAPAFFNLLDFGALLLVLPTFTQDRRLIWLSIWIFYLTNWVGQDYFSPQALNYFLYLIILGICLRWFRVSELGSKENFKRGLVFERMRALYHRFVSLSVRSDVTESVASPLQRVALIGMVILLFAAIATSHPLTPFVALLTFTLLVIFRCITPRSLPILMGVIAVSWVLFGADTFVRGQLPGVIASLGQLMFNLNTNLVNVSKISPDQQLVSFMGRGLTVLVFCLAFVGLIRRVSRDQWELASTLLATTPIVLLAVNSYGGEMLLRAYFFALPFTAFLAAATLYPGPDSGKSWWTTILATLLCGTLLIGFLFAYYGKDQMYYFTKNEVAAAEYLYNTAPTNSLLVEGTGNYPTQFHNYEYFTYVPISMEPEKSQTNVIDSPVQVLSRWMSDSRYAAAYLIITRSQKAEVNSLGTMPPGSLDTLEQTLMQSPQFELLYSNQDAKIFVLAHRSPGGQK